MKKLLMTFALTLFIYCAWGHNRAALAQDGAAQGAGNQSDESLNKPGPARRPPSATAAPTAS